jgi:hypothetical protein
MEAYGIVRRRRSHIFYAVGSQMAVRLSALRACHVLPPKRILELISDKSRVNPRVTVRLEGLGKLKKFQWFHRDSNSDFLLSQRARLLHFSREYRKFWVISLCIYSHVADFLYLEYSDFQSQNQSHNTTDSQPAGLSWCQAAIWDPRLIFPVLSLLICRKLRICWCGRPLWREDGSVICSALTPSSISCYIATDGLPVICASTTRGQFAIADRGVRTSHMSDIRQTSVAIQRLVDSISW